ncbi:MAG: hypothetical protein GVY06_05705 [Alphaproteobacteria bacterium]|jgi:hypothetical protein|nr:hypothetical protein [Alphaproteobacteria bacterium]
MKAVIAYFKLVFLVALIAALYPAIHYIWTGTLPGDLVPIGATLGLLALVGLVITLISRPGKPPADKTPV